MMTRILLVLTAVLLVAAPAQAQDAEMRLPPEDFSEQSKFVPAEHGAHACWAASFEPARNVSAMRFSIAFEEVLPNTDENWPEGRQFFNYELAATLSDGSSGTAAGTCHGLAGGGIICEVECDGGGATVRLDEAGNALVDLRPTGYIRLAQCGAEETAVELQAGADDSHFVLSPTPGSECEPVVRMDATADAD